MQFILKPLVLGAMCFLSAQASADACDGNVMLGSVNSGVADRAVNGACINDMILDAPNQWGSHGEFVSHVAEVVNSLSNVLSEVSSYGVVVADKEGRITSFQEKPAVEEAKSNLINTGIYIFEPEALSLIPSNCVFDIGSDLFPLLVEKGLPFYALQQDFNWIDIGKVSDYWQTMQRVMMHEVEGIRMPGREVRPGVWVGLNVKIDWRNTRIDGPVYIGSGSRIEAGCQIIGPTWIAHGCHLHENVRMTRSILFEHTRVRAGAEFDEQIVVGDYCVSREGKTVHVEEVGIEWIWCDARIASLLEHQQAMMAG